MKISMVTLWTKNIEWFALPSIKGKRGYAQENGYHFMAVEGVFDATRRAQWSKIPLILSAMPFCDWVFWTDADSFVVNRKPKLEEYIDDRYDMIVSSDVLEPKRFRFNMGNAFVKNSEWSHRFLSECYERYESKADEQFTMEKVYDESEEAREKIKIVADADFNVLWRAIDSSVVSSEQLRFIVHFAGTQRYIPWLLEKRSLWDGTCKSRFRDARPASVKTSGKA